MRWPLPGPVKPIAMHPDHPSLDLAEYSAEPGFHSVSLAYVIVCACLHTILLPLIMTNTVVLLTLVLTQSLPFSRVLDTVMRTQQDLKSYSFKADILPGSSP